MASGAESDYENVKNKHTNFTEIKIILNMTTRCVSSPLGEVLLGGVYARPRRSNGDMHLLLFGAPVGVLVSMGRLPFP